MPRSVRAARVLLYVVGVGTLLATIGSFLYSPMGAEAAGAATVYAVPGVLSLVAALRLSRGGRGVWWFVLVLQVLYVLYQFGRMATGAVGGLIGVIFPVVILVLVLRRPAREYARAAKPR